MKTFLLKHKQLVPVLVLLGLSVYTVFAITTGTIILNNKVAHYNFTMAHYAGWMAITCCLLSYFLARRVFKYVLIATISLGLFGVLNFTRNEFKFSLRINALVLNLQPASFFIGVLTFAINGNKVKELILKRKKIKQQEEKTDNALQFKSDLAKYRVQYQDSSNEELSKVVNDKRYTAGAKEAASLILEERTK